MFEFNSSGANVIIDGTGNHAHIKAEKFIITPRGHLIADSLELKVKENMFFAGNIRISNSS